MPELTAAIHGPPDLSVLLEGGRANSATPASMRGDHEGKSYVAWIRSGSSSESRQAAQAG